MLAGHCLQAQEIGTMENFGNTLNAGTGIGYYKYVGYTVPMAHLDFELQIDRNLTVAPFVNMYTYQSSYLWGDANNEAKAYHYTETVVPVGLKVSYYFDEIVNARPNWDFYASGALGFNYRKTTWDTSYKGKHQIDPGMGPLYLDFHIGTEYHVTATFGLLLDVSANAASLGLAIHFLNQLN
jgi:hypothetical protein